jgi:hypothetical protein
MTRAVGLVLALLLMLVAPALADDELPVVRLRVPSAQVPQWFPVGTELKGMKAGEFDDLLRAARVSARRRSDTKLPRLLKATHEARWQDGRLVGRSVLVIEPARARAAALVLDPWTPAVTVGDVRSDAAGRTSIWVQPNREGVTTAALDWRLEARPETEGRSFSLGLPGAPVGLLALDLPAGMEPAGPLGLRVGPIPGDMPGRSRWVFHGPDASHELSVRATGSDDALAGYVVEGDTRVDLDEAGANWRLTWSVHGARRTSKPLLVLLDPALSLLEVSGPDVEGFQVEPDNPAADGTRVSIRLSPREDRGPTLVTIHALAEVALGRPWRVPSARPLNALWTGGRTEVRLDASRMPIEVRALSARRVAPPAGFAVDERRLVFDAQRPESVAELILGTARAEVAAEVVGQLVVGRDAPRISARVIWRVDRGRPQGLDLELPRSWFAERVEFEGLAEPASWSPEVRPDGSVRVRVAPPSGEFPGKTVTVLLGATATVAGGRGPLALPRVRPLGARVSDELWVARAESGMTLRPTQARGLGWVDVAGLAPDASRAADAADTSQPVLAWRWTAEDGAAQIERSWSESSARGQVDMVVAASSDRVTIRARVEVVAGEEPVRSVRLGLDSSREDSAWRVTDAATGLILRSRPVAPPASAERTIWQEFPLSQPRVGRVTLEVRWESKWSGTGKVPLIFLPSELRPRGSVLLLAAPDVRTLLNISGGRRFAPGLLAESFPVELVSGSGPDLSTGAAEPRPMHAFAYSGPDAVCELTTETLTTEGGGGLIREAVLTTSAAPGEGEPWHRLVLKVVPDRATSLEVGLPSGAHLEQVRRDGMTLVPSVVGSSLSIPLGATPAGGTRPIVTLALEYRGSGAVEADGHRLRPARPRFSMPCLGLCWELLAPEDWSVVDFGPALTSADPSRGRGRLSERLAGGRFHWQSSWLGNTLRPRRDVGAEALRALGARLAEQHVEALSLGEWLTRLDAGTTPLVVDRGALAQAGWGPRSQVTPPQAEPSNPIAPATVFRELGMAVIPIGDALLVTTAEESTSPAFAGARSLDERGRWASTVSDAVVWGVDESGRFQSVERWRESATTRAALSTDWSSRTRRGPLRLAERFVSVGWPEYGCEVGLIDRRSQAAWGWAVALGLIASGLFARSWPRPTRAFFATALLGIGLIASAQATPAWSSVANGLTAGAFALLLFWSGSALAWARWLSSRRGARTPSTRTFRRPVSNREVAAPLLLVLVGGATLCRAQLKTPAPAGPILVLAPYDGAPDPTRAPDRIVLRLSDYERLRTLADEADAASEAVVFAQEATHRVVWRGVEAVLVESELTLAIEGNGSVRWRFPIVDSLATTAALDGVEVPLRVEPGGKSAALDLEVTPEAKRTRRLKIRRTVVPRKKDGAWTIALPINPVATAQLEVKAHPEGFRAEIPTPREVDDGAEARLGPVARLEVQWRRPGEKGSQPVAGTVDALYLWDSTLAGDRVRARLTYRNPAATPVVRVRLDSSTIVREATIPGLADVSVVTTPGGREWVARCDPPLADGATVVLDVWRPRAASDGAEVRKPGIAPATMPRVEPLGVERVTASSAFRRPADWSGRIAPEVEEETLGEETFARLWGGTLPAEPLTLSGATRQVSLLGRYRIPQVETGFLAPRVRVQPVVQLNVGSGRIDLSAEARWNETGEPVYEVEVELPAAIRLDRVSGNGLTSWEIGAGNLLRLHFDGPTALSRNIRFHGWIPVPQDPLELLPPSRELAVPWPRWRNQEELPGTLVVTSASRFQILGPAGAVTPGAIEPPVGSSGASATIRATYRVDKPDTLGTLRWEVEPPRVAVFVRSQLTLDPDTAAWVAVLRYVVSGGPLEEINLRLPTEWAREATVRLDGVGHRRTVEIQGATTLWTLRPERPIWGAQRVVVRSTLQFPPGESRAFPELRPRGRGESDTFLRLVNATREPITKEARRVQEVAPQSFPTEEELDELTPKPAVSTTYHVMRGDWSLRVNRSGRTGDDRPDRNVTRPARAEIQCMLAADETVWGLARYRLATPTEPFFAVDLPRGVTPIWASVDSRATVPLRSPSGGLLISLPEDAVDEVLLAWRSDTPARGSISLPHVGTQPLPTVVQLCAPTGMAIAHRADQLLGANPETIDLEEARRLAIETIGGLTRFDRSSRRDAENLVAALIRIELRLRQGVRAAAWEGDETSAARVDRVRGVSQTAEGIRKQLADAIRVEALDELWESARVQLGLTSSMTGKSITQATPEAVSPAQFPTVGRPSAFLGEWSGAPDALTWTHAAPDDPERTTRLLLMLFALAAPFVAWLVARNERVVSIARPALLMLGLVAAGLWAGPIWLAVGLGCAAWGSLARGA